MLGGVFLVIQRVGAAAAVKHKLVWYGATLRPYLTEYTEATSETFHHFHTSHVLMS